MNEINVIVGNAKSGKSYFAYHSINEKIRKDDGVFTLDFYKDSSIMYRGATVNSIFTIADMDYIIRQFDDALNKSRYKVVIFDGFEQLINQMRKEISYVIPSNNYFNNSDFVNKYIKLKVYEWISSLLNRDINITIISNLNCFDNFDDMNNFMSLIDIFQWKNYINKVKVRRYETYVKMQAHETEGYITNEFWVRDIHSRSKKEENRLMNDLIKELSESK